MNEQLIHSLSQITDVAFVLLVISLAIKVFRRDAAFASSDHKQNDEIRQLELSLRELIDEAGAASRNFDRNLVSRKSELESLLRKFEEKEQLLLALPKVIHLDDPLPTKTTERIASQYAANEQAALTVRAQQKKPTQAPLQKQLEIARDSQERSREPAVYKVARRLLTQGKAIHIVARKLELPLSEVRALARELDEDVVTESISQRDSLARGSVETLGTQDKSQTRPLHPDDGDELSVL